MKAVAATGRGKPLKVQTLWTDSARNKAEVVEAEQTVMRLRKPEGGAQSSEANSMLVAAFTRKRRKGAKPHGRADC